MYSTSALFCIFGRYSFTEAELKHVFPGKVWPYRCSECTRFFLKPTAGMVAWKEEARRNATAGVMCDVSALPVSQCRRAKCSACTSRLHRARVPPVGGPLAAPPRPTYIPPRVPSSGSSNGESVAGTGGTARARASTRCTPSSPARPHSYAPWRWRGRPVNRPWRGMDRLAIQRP